MSKDDGRPAFPVTGYAGMSLRDYFAAAMLPVIAQILQEFGRSRKVIIEREEVAAEAYRYADAMLAERDK